MFVLSNKQYDKAMKTEFKSDYQLALEAQNVKEVFNDLKFAEFNSYVEVILDFVSQKSTSFVADIAKKHLENVDSLNHKNTSHLSDKQLWCVAYEFLRLKDQLKNWIDEQIEEGEEMEKEYIVKAEMTEMEVVIVEEETKDEEAGKNETLAFGLTEVAFSSLGHYKVVARSERIKFEWDCTDMALIDDYTRRKDGESHRALIRPTITHGERIYLQ